MPNLRQLVALQKKYNRNKHNGLHGFTVEKLEKSFSITTSSISNEIKSHFDTRKKHYVTLLYIDIANFTQQYGYLSPFALSNFLDNYYNTVVPIIYDYGGEVERLTGDGIICIFGEPFSEEKVEIEKKWAFICAQKIIHTCYLSDFPVKIAFHSGEVMYYSPPTEDFQEYTMIGNTLTELYRLESVSEVNSISFYKHYLPTSIANNRVPVSNIKNHLWLIIEKNKNIQSFGIKEITFCQYNENHHSNQPIKFPDRYKYNSYTYLLS